jgi:hypothetical protein
VVRGEMFFTVIRNLLYEYPDVLVRAGSLHNPMKGIAIAVITVEQAMR